jgi:hypothetical protein
MITPCCLYFKIKMLSTTVATLMPEANNQSPSPTNLFVEAMSLIN